ncbi:hypothetical protein N568_0101245 [Lactococcus garvieae TRF1]|uniref:Uncharacterized protein n=1 Tax=Lactococcus garvieae TRF1 TaxID=1380772 RepID=V8ASA5_9LACT|nr:hypothetical protein N568_0101245 [Lactococcus garvieae TRF1]
MKKKKRKLRHKFDFDNMHEDLQFIVLFLFMIVGAIIAVITYPFRFFKKRQEEEHEEFSFGRYEIREIPKTESGDIIMNLTVKQFIEELSKAPQEELVTLPYGENGNSIGISGLAIDDDVVEIIFGEEI